MKDAAWFIAVGLLLITMSTISASLKRLPVTAAILYLIIGFLLGPAVSGSIHLNAISNISLVRRVAEISVIISLFTAGLTLRLPLRSPQWRIPLILASLSMLITIALSATAAYLLLGIPVGAAILLGAILAPTDPVLASSVQLISPEDTDRARFSLTGEASLNDGMAFPFVMLGLGLLGVHELGPLGARWLFVDVVWAVAGGLGVGTALGTVVERGVAILRRKYGETESLDDFLAMGLIALSYGVALLIHTYAFLSVFAAGLAIGRAERRESQRLGPTGGNISDELLPQRVSADMAAGALQFNEQLERIGEIIAVVMLGSLLTHDLLDFRYLLLALALLLIRPIAVFIGARAVDGANTLLLSWFGIRGIGSIYYVAFAIDQGVPREHVKTLLHVTFTAVAISIVAHGISATPLMIRHSKRAK